VCGGSGGIVEIRRTMDLGVISSFEIHSLNVDYICELEDGSFVSSDGGKINWFDENGRVLQSISYGHHPPICGLIELKGGKVSYFKRYGKSQQDNFFTS